MVPTGDAERALALATRHLDASMPAAIEPQALLRALNGLDAERYADHLYAFLDEVEVETMSDLVRAGATTYERLAAAARGRLPRGHATRLWLDERSGQPMGNPA